MDFEEVVYWRGRFKFENDFEKTIWFGESAMVKEDYKKQYVYKKQ